MARPYFASFRITFNYFLIAVHTFPDTSRYPVHTSILWLMRGFVELLLILW